MHEFYKKSKGYKNIFIFSETAAPHTACQMPCIEQMQTPETCVRKCRAGFFPIWHEKCFLDQDQVFYISGLYPVDINADKNAPETVQPH